MTFLSRLGLAIVRPRAAFALAADRDHAGRSGSDLLALILIVLVATQLRGIVGAIWLGSAVGGSLGMQAIVRVLTDALVIDLAFLVVGALVIWAASGPKRELGRAFDVACVAVLPLVFVDLVATVAVTALSVHAPTVALSIIAYVWTAIWIILAVLEARSAPRMAEPNRLATRTGWGIGAVVLVGLAVQGIWLVNHLDSVRPMTQGQAAPTFTLPVIGTNTTFALEPGKVTVLDFWATWCNPCLKSLPSLEALHQKHPEIDVIAINLDDANDAAALFKEEGYTMTLVEGDPETSAQYGVDAIPHTVVIDRAGRVQRVLRGGHHDLESLVAPLLR
jgi:thiol-disulfide isomerase/thioredoxin